MRQIVQSVGTKGVNKDVKSISLPPEFWTDARNIRFVGTKAQTMFGTSGLNINSDRPIWVDFVRGRDTNFWLYANFSNVFAHNGSTLTDITRVSGNYSTQLDKNWHLEVFNGIPFLNNGSDTPQVWNPSILTQPLVDLPNWPSGYVARGFAGFKSHLFALGILQGSTEYLYDIFWSHKADPGAIPDSWDITDATKDAGRVSIDDTNAGPITAAKIFGDYLAVYQEKAMTLISFVGGNAIFGKKKVLSDTGCINAKTLVSLPGNRPQHFFQSIDDFLLFDGQQVTPVFESRVRNYILKNCNLDKQSLAFSVTFAGKNELWYCFAETGALYPSLAVIWNYRHNNITFRALADVTFIGVGVDTEVSIRNFSSLESIPFSDETYFSDNAGFALVEPTIRELALEASLTGNKLYLNGYGKTLYGDPIVPYLERRGMAVIGKDRNDDLIYNYTHRKILHRIFPHVTKGNVNIYLAGTEYEDEVPVYGTPIAVTPTDTTVSLPRPVSGKFLNFKFEATDDFAFEIDGFAFDVQTLGMF